MAKAFDAEPLEYHDECLRRMTELTKRRAGWKEQTEEMITARKRMALFPSKNVEVIFPTEDLWVPVVRMGGKLCILPGVPRLFEALIEGMQPFIPLDPNRPRPYRLLVHTALPESTISPYLSKLNDMCKKEDIKVGSYPKWNGGVDVSLIGIELERLQEIAKDVEKEVEGKTIAQGKLGEEKKTAAL
jgi:molybdopterin-biosynthesis enzyme MoeA-like protein